MTFVTDGSNYILDCDFGRIDDPARLETRIDASSALSKAGFSLAAPTRFSSLMRPAFVVSTAPAAIGAVRRSS